MGCSVTTFAGRCVLALGAVFLTTPGSAQTSLIPTLERLRAEYPTPMSSAQIGEYLNRVAWEHRGEGWGLLYKPGGTNCDAPQGLKVSCDVLFHLPTLGLYDVLVDG